MTPPAILEAVSAFGNNELGVMLQAAGVTQAPKRKEERVALWVSLIGDPARIRQALAQLPPRAVKALQTLQAHGGELRTNRYRALLERSKILEARPVPRRGTPGSELTREPVSFEETLSYLLKYGLVWSYGINPPRTVLGWDGGRMIYIPREVAVHLPPVPPALPAQPTVTYVLAGSARTCQRDLYLTWSAARETPLQLTVAGLMRVSDLRRLAGQLLVSESAATGVKESDLRRVLFLRRLATALGLVQQEWYEATERIVAAPAPSFLQENGPERVQKCFLSWRDGNWWNELWATYVQGSTRASGTLSDPAPAGVVQARKTVMEALVRLTGGSKPTPQTERAGGEWLAVDAIAEYLRDHDEDFLIERHSAMEVWNYHYQRYVSSPYLGNDLGWSWEQYANEETGWKGVETVFVRAVLAEGLYWLGLVDLGYANTQTPAGGSAPPNLEAVRLTDMGKWLLLGEARPIVPAEAGRVVVQPNFHVFAFDPISDSVLARLDLFAARLNAERVIEYEITRESVYRAQESGTQAPAIEAWLEEVTGSPLPQNVARTLAEWQADYERITVWPEVAWLQAASADLIDRLLQDADLARAVVKRVTPTGLLIRSDRANAVEEALLAANEVPTRVGSAQDARPGSIRVNADGSIAFTQAMPSLYTYGFLQPFADVEEGWHVTLPSVRRAIRNGRDAAWIISELQALAAGGVPDELARKIKAWAGHFGDALVGTFTLVQFRDHATLLELLEDPELAACLKPFKPEARLGLASVSPGDLPRLRSLLADRGVELHETEHIAR